MRNKLYFFIAIFITIHHWTFAQDMERIITVNYDDQTLETILTHMEQDLGLKFSFLQSAIPLDTVITLKLANQPLRTVLNALSEKAGLEYKVVKDHIALFHISLEPIEKENPFETRKELPVPLEASVVMQESTKKETEEMMIDTIPLEIKYAQLSSISNISLIEPQNHLSVLSYDSFRKHSVLLPELPRKQLLSLGLVISGGFYLLSGKADENKSFDYKTGVNYSVGLSTDLKIKERWRFIVQVLYSTRNFDLYYNFQTVDEDDPFIPEKTVYQQSYLDIPILLDYRVLEKGRWKLFGEAGFVPDFLLNSEKQTFHKDGSEMETPEFLEMKIRPQLFGAQLDIMAEYEIGKYFSLELSTGWRQYFNGINKENLKTKLGMFQGAAGVRYTL
ncbi:MAG: outer membrane beta-barrel protein [Cytophagales bacterium]|nr:outer membrane beta-barrel protein [Cytophagales bacterium]